MVVDLISIKIPKEEPMNEESTNTNPSKLKYIGVWVLCGFISNVLGRILDNILAGVLISDFEQDLNSYFLIGAALTVPIVSGVFILVYNYFSSLNMKRGMIYVYVLGGLGTLVNFVAVSRIYAPFGVDLSTFYLSYTAAFLVSVYIIRSYFIKNPERWY